MIINVSKTHEKGEQFEELRKSDSIHSIGYATTEEILAACNRRIIVAEDVGGKAPWECDLTGDVMLVVGAENAGVSRKS